MKTRLFFVILFFLLLLSVNAASEPTIVPSPESETVVPGNDVVIDINVSDVVDLFGLGFVVTYDAQDSIEPVSSEKTGFMGSDVLFISQPDNADDTVAVGISRKQGQGGVGGSGTVASVTLRISSTAPEGTTVTLTLEDVTANSSDGSSLDLAVQSASFTISTSSTPNSQEVGYPSESGIV